MRAGLPVFQANLSDFFTSTHTSVDAMKHTRERLYFRKLACATTTKIADALGLLEKTFFQLFLAIVACIGGLRKRMEAHGSWRNGVATRVFVMSYWEWNQPRSEIRTTLASASRISIETSRYDKTRRARGNFKGVMAHAWTRQPCCLYRPFPILVEPGTAPDSQDSPL